MLTVSLYSLAVQCGRRWRYDGEMLFSELLLHVFVNGPIFRHNMTNRGPRWTSLGAVGAFSGVIDGGKL